MKLLNGKIWPDDYVYEIKKGTKKNNYKDYYEIPYGKQVRKYNLVPVILVKESKYKEGRAIDTYQFKHHPVYRLIQDISRYNLNNVKEKAEFMNVLGIALLWDEYNLIGEHYHKMSVAFDKTTSWSELNEFFEKLDNIEEKQKQLKKIFLLPEVIEEQAQKQSKGLAVKVKKGPKHMKGKNAS